MNLANTTPSAFLIAQAHPPSSKWSYPTTHNGDNGVILASGSSASSQPVSYIALLPPEILSRIFWFASDSDKLPLDKRGIHPYRSIRRGGVPFPLLAAQVSVYWREVITSYIELFSRVDVYSDESLRLVRHALGGSGSTHTVELNVDIYDWERLGCRTLGLHSGIEGLSLDQEAIASAITRLDQFKETSARLIADYAHRWKSFTLFTYNEETGYDILSKLEGCPAPALESVTVNCEVTFPADVPEGKERYFFDGKLGSRATLHRTGSAVKVTAPSGNGPGEHYWDKGKVPAHSGDTQDGLVAPNLRRASLESTFSWPPVSNLTTLRLQRSNSRPLLPPPHVIRLLQQTPLLETLQLHHYMDYMPWPVHPIPIIMLPHLKLLSLVETGMGVAKFLLTIWAPELESLWVECSYADGLELMTNHRQPPPDQQHPQIRIRSTGAVAIPPALLKLGSTPRRPQPARDLEQEDEIRALHFPKLRYLTLQSFSALRLGIFADVLPGITTLHLSYCPIWSLPFIHNVFQNGARWPSLHTIAIRTTRDMNPIGDQFLTAWMSMVQEREQGGHPLKRILADNGFLKSLLSGRGIGLRGIVQVEELNEETYDEPGWCLREQGLF